MCFKGGGVEVGDGFCRFLTTFVVGNNYFFPSPGTLKRFPLFKFLTLDNPHYSLFCSFLR